MDLLLAYLAGVATPFIAVAAFLLITEERALDAQDQSA